MRKMKAVLLCIGLFPGFQVALSQVNSPVMSHMNPGLSPPAPAFSSVKNTTQKQKETAPAVNYNPTGNLTPQPFSVSYKPTVTDSSKNTRTLTMLRIYSENEKTNAYEKQDWELKLPAFRFADPASATANKLEPYYRLAFDSINQMLQNENLYDLKKAVFLVENAYYGGKLDYKIFCRLIEEKVAIIDQLLTKEKLDRNNNVALNYAIQQLYIKPVQYTDKNGAKKTHPPFRYDFEDYMGKMDYSKQFITKFLYTGKGQCHSMPLLYMILAAEIGAKAKIAYSPEHSYISFPDNGGNFYNFECTSACFPSNAFIMSSGYVKSEAVKSGIYMQPVGTKELLAGQLNDLAVQETKQFMGINDFQLKCAKRTLEIWPNNAMALMTIANYQTAKTEAALCRAGWPDPKTIVDIPEVKEEFDKRDQVYEHIDDLGYSPVPPEIYEAWLKQVNREKFKQESEAIKKAILIKATQH